MNEFNILPLFSTPLYQSNEDLPPTILEAAKKNKYNVRDISNKIVVSKNSIHPENVPGLFPILTKHINNYLFKLLELDERRFNYKFSDGWFVKVEPGGYTGRPHTHDHSLLTGVIYLQTNKDSGELSFSKTPFCNFFSMGINLPFLKNERHIYNTTVWNVSPKNGDILIFPSYLNHSIFPNNSNEVRYSYAFNIVPVGVIGDIVSGRLIYS